MGTVEVVETGRSQYVARDSVSKRLHRRHSNQIYI